MEDREACARRLAERMPLVHFPVSARFEEWSTSWAGLVSRAERGEPIGAGNFEQLRGEHVFVYAGPSCFHNKRGVGDAVLYFDPAAEEGRTGSATPFDGFLEDPGPTLQPFAQGPVEARWDFLQQQMIPLATWRTRFGVWLSRAYEKPERYLDTSPDRHAAGEPDRLEPPELLEHNGTRGIGTYGRNGCGDRRAWTWEVRIARALPFERVYALHVPFDAFQRAAEVSEKMKWLTGETPRIETLAPGVAADAQALYEDSGRVLGELVKK